CVNDRPFDDNPMDTLLLLAAEVKPYRLVSGTRVCDITYKMKYFQCIKPSNGRPYLPPQGHNHFLRYSTLINPVTGRIPKPDYIELTSTGYPSIGPVPPPFNVNTPAGNILFTPENGDPVYRRVDFRDLFNPDESIVSGHLGDE